MLFKLKNNFESSKNFYNSRESTLKIENENKTRLELILTNI